MWLAQQVDSVHWCTGQRSAVSGGQLSGSDSKDHDDAQYDHHYQVDGQHDLLETMTLHTRDTYTPYTHTHLVCDPPAVSDMNGRARV